MKNNILKSILATILLLLGVSHAAWADAGFWDNGGVVLTFRVDGTTKEVSLNNNVTTQDFGSLSSLSLNQVLCNVWKDGSGNICSATAYYKIDEGSYSSGFATIYSSSNGNNQVWKGTFDANLLNGVSVGAHKLTLYFMATGSTSSSSDCSQNIYYSNNSQNYVFTFTYCTTPTIAWGTAPADGTVGGNMTATVSTNQTSPTVTWTSSNTSVATVDANGKITYVAAGTTTITASYTGDGTTYCAETVSVSKDITVTAAATALNIYVQGRFKVRTSEGGSEWKYTGSADDDSWNTSSTNIKFEYEEATGYYKLNTYCSVKELSASINNTNYYYFHFKEGSTEYGATDDNIKPALEANKRTIQSGDKNFIFTTSDCEKGDNVVLYLDWSNKTFWYAVDPTYTVTYDYNGGSGSETSATCKQGEAVTLPTPNTREGYTFNGWYTAATDGTLAGAAGATYTPTGDITLYAQWLKDYSADTYYYYDEKGDWQDTVCKALTKLTEYSFVELENSYILDRDGNKNKFKIFDKNTKRKDNWNTETEATHLVANGDNIAEKLADENLRNQLKGNIKLTNTGDNFNNAQYDTMSINEASFFVVLYYPNTSLNSSNNFVLAAMTTLPDAEKYNVTFGVVDNVGGTLTAKSSDGSTISSGALVSYATFTATPDAGYAVEGWYSDAEGTQRIDAAGTSTTYSQAITEANNSVYVKFAQVRAVYFKNNHNWSEVHIYTFSNDPFNSDYNDKDNNTQDETHKKGIGPAGALEKAQMTHIGDDIYMYQLTKANKFKYIAFTSKNQYGYDNFYDYNDVVSRTDHNDTTGLFMYIPDKSESANTVNKNGDNHANYFYKGVWMKPNSTDAGYELVIHTSSVNDHKYAYFKAPTAGGFEFSYETVLTGGVTYSFFVKNDNNNYFGRGSDAGNTTISSTTNDLEMYLWGSGDVGEVSFTPVISGTYTFTLHLQDGRVLIDVIYPTTQYRLVYVEKDGSTIKKFHPSHIIKQRAGGTAEAPLYDTVSMHVRPYIRTWKEDTQKYDTTQNNTSMVWLQEFKKADENSNSMDWVTIKTIDTQKQKNITTNGVYNFVIKQDGSSATIDTTKTYPYTGRYYVRTDASDGGWNNYKQLSNYCYYNEYSRVYRGFDHYYCHWTTANTNIKYTIACDYSYCVSDTLAKEDHTPHNDFTDENDKFKYNANIRFMWNSFDNTLDRAYIAGAGENLVLLSDSLIYNTDGTENKSVILSDQENWVYRADVQAKANARIKLRAIPFNGSPSNTWFRGKDGDFSEANTELLIQGTKDKTYLIRIIYDFKTDHLICAWVPNGVTISDTTIINTDLMIIRKDNGDAAQLLFNPAASKLGSVTTAFCVVTLSKSLLENTSLTPQERGCFFVSFPFDVNLSDVFGCGIYGVDYVIQYYDGASRAQKGWWSDSPTFWRYVWDPTNFILEKGKGYILAVDYDKILTEQFQYKNTEVNIYFPSANMQPMDITGELPSAVTIEEHLCTIQREQRYIYDSNWNLIGVPSWANVNTFPIQETKGNEKVGFLYDYNAKTDTWTASAATDTTFQSMYAYMVQWAGTISWKDKTLNPDSSAKQALQARRYAPAAEGEEEGTSPEQYTLRLTLNRGEQQLDHTYVRLQEGDVTTDFDLNYDMTKILNSGANLYSLVGTNLIQCAANVQPLQEDAQTISIPLGVVADQDGLYTFSLPDGTEGMNVSLVDNESGTVHNLALGDYQTALTAGTYEQRFALEIQPRHEVSTGCEQTDAAGKRLRKVLIDGNLYILRDGKAYTATGNEL